MSHTILVIDDDEPIHIMAKSLLGKEFQLVNARDSQEAINILSETPVNLILSDIHMPGLSGLELLESIRDDKEKSKIPVLIMTNLPTVEKEQKALDLGAVDFIKKERFNTDREGVIELVRMKILTDVNVKGLDEDLEKSKNKLVMKLMESAIKGSFTDTAETFCSYLSDILKSDLLTFFVLEDGNPKPLISHGDNKPSEADFTTFQNSNSFNHLNAKKESYLSNHIYNEEFGCFLDFSTKNEMPAEIGVPLFSANEKAMLMNNLSAPTESELFGMLIIKRSKLFSSKEFELISRLVTQTGAILWRLYQKNK
ncbi:MAG: response regulator [Balneola sp.]|jgi:CheY-like chemotaxis protein